MATQDAPDPDEIKQLDVERRKLECQKLQAEIVDLSLRWWQRPSYIGSVLTLAALLTGWVSGYFPSERESLNREIAGLRSEKQGHTQEALLLNSDLARLKDERNKLATEVQQAEDKMDVLYIRLRLAVTDARYAISHIDPAAAGIDASQLSKDRGRLSDLLKRMSGSDAEFVQRLGASHELSAIIAPIAARDLKNLDGVLSSLPGAKRLSLQFTSPMEIEGNGKTYQSDAVKKASDSQLLEWFRTK